MAYTALYREMRPQVFRDVIGQDHITTVLKNELKDGRVAHAYLFSGTRGTGKTTCAKIFAKALNCLDPIDGEPCNVCENCQRIDAGLSLDVVEQDAATNNKVDDIRELIDEVQYPPQEGKFKVYILDEAHMLTMGAVNAFLKTLEEPPSSVVFILATTDPQKLPITILSRCQRFDFKRIRAKDIEKRLREIVQDKGILADNKSLELISRVSEGAMRDALSILDQTISMGQGTVEYDVVVSMLGLLGKEKLFELAAGILHKDIEKSLAVLDEMSDAGKDAYFITKDLETHFRNILVTKLTRSNTEDLVEAPSEDLERYREQGLMIRDQEIIKILRILQSAEAQTKGSVQGRIYLELALIKICHGEMDYGMDSLVARMAKLEEVVKAGAMAPRSPAQDNVTGKAQGPGKGATTARTTKEKALGANKTSGKVTEQEPAPMEEEVVANPDSKLTLDSVRGAWNEVEEALRAKRQMIIRASLFEVIISQVKDGIITLAFPENYSMSKKRLEKPEFKSVLEDTVSMILGEKIHINLQVMNSAGPAQESVDPVESAGFDDIDIHP